MEGNHRDRHKGGLIWGPVYRPLETLMRSGDEALLLISPFITLEALEKCLHFAGTHNDLKVVVRWRPGDLLAGVSDLEIYPYLAERGIPLFLNPNIHLKLYVFGSNSAFSTSGNLTLRGLGYIEESNIEVGSFVNLTQEDWANIFAIIKSSRQVDEPMYQRYKQYIDSCPKILPPIPPPENLLGTLKTYTISTLPALETPVKLAEFYFNADSAKCTAEEIRRAAHDLVTFSVPPKLDHAEFDQRLYDSFRETPFVVEFVEVLKVEKSLRFGAVNDWIHRKCEDVPLPYRWEIKENTRILYNWLEHFFPEVSWDRPNYSQVIYWKNP